MLLWLSTSLKETALDKSAMLQLAYVSRLTAAACWLLNPSLDVFPYSALKERFFSVLERVFLITAAPSMCPSAAMGKSLPRMKATNVCACSLPMVTR